MYFRTIMIQLENRTTALVFHIIFWIAFLLVSLSITNEVFGAEQIWIRVGSVAASFAVLVYLNHYLLIPQLFLKGRYLLFVLSILVATGIISVIRVEFDTCFLGEDHTLPLRSKLHYVFVYVTYILILFVTSSFKFMRHTYEKVQLEQELTNYKLDAELKFLKAQVNPHFLFNTLNNIYSLNQVDPEKSSEMILKLSDMMRYMLYESNDKKVPLDNEIKYLRNYIDLQQMRTRDKQNVELEVVGNTTNVTIEPMFFVPLLENSFKHGNVGDTEKGWIKCTLSINDNEVDFAVTNSLGHQHQRKDRVGGIGLENVKKRLQLLYPCMHCFETVKEDGIFTSNVKIQLA